MLNNSSSSKFDLTINFDQAGEQTTGNVKRVTGLVKIKHLIPLIDKLELEANPRDSRVGNVTNDIRESLEKTPETFPFKTKGILVGASQYEARDRNRYFVTFTNPAIEGILDGGHNTMAIGLYILNLALGDEASAEIKKVKIWNDFKDLWEASREKVALYRQSLSPEDAELETLVPLELLLPNDPEDFNSVEQFSKSLLEICAARNNNVQLKTEAKANQAGYFDSLRDQLDPAIANRIEWRPNDGGDIKVADVVALSWIALAKIDNTFVDEDGRSVEAPNATQIYSSKGECVSRFERLLSSPDVSETNAGDFKRDLKNKKVLSAFKLTADILKLYDYIYEAFPDLYNANDGRFGGITTVKKMNDAARTKRTKFGNKDISWKYPDGFIVPLVYGLGALIEEKEDGSLGWSTDPYRFLKDHLADVVTKYKGVIAVVQHDPQKVGKAAVSYTTAEDAFETAFLKAAAGR